MTDRKQENLTPDQEADPSRTPGEALNAAVSEALEQMLREEEEKLLGRQDQVSDEFWIGRRWSSVYQEPTPARSIESMNEVLPPPGTVTYH